VIKKMGYEWHLRRRMAEAGMFQTRELQPLLAERGVQLSREQVYRLATQPPLRLTLDVLAALCDILDCTPNDLIEIQAVDQQARKAAVKGRPGTPPVRRTTIRRPEGA
jgi:DNA-binding Xre family transcriptional regulator